MKFIMINGPSCVGKSTLAQEILENTENFFHLSYDSIKWSFSKYTSGKFVPEIIHLMCIMISSLAENKIGVVCDSAIQKVYREELIEAAEASGYEIVRINLEADYGFLAGRFEERMKNLDKSPHKHARTTKERHREIFDQYHREKDPSAKTFYTDKESIEDIAREILKLV